MQNTKVALAGTAFVSLFMLWCGWMASLWMDASGGEFWGFVGFLATGLALPVICYAISLDLRARKDQPSAQLAERPNADDYRNRAERAEAEAAELREAMKDRAFQAFADEQQWLDLQNKAARYDALMQHANMMAVMIEGHARIENCHECRQTLTEYLAFQGKD